MKKLIPFFSVAVIMAACNSAPKANADAIVASASQQALTAVTDTVGLASYQAWKAQNELADATNYNQAPEPQKPFEKIVKVKKTSKSQASLPTPEPAALPSTPAASSEKTTVPSSDNSTATGGNETASVPAGQTTTEEKKGWSNKAKGAVIGGVVGAGAGAVINKKNPVLGAVIGGVIGAGGGYVIGGKMDKKDVKLPVSGIGL
ncbi:MAG: glycine zipper domain-containing protein [Flavisolibacter sp.]|jgi:hypothetical protein